MKNTLSKYAVTLGLAAAAVALTACSGSATAESDTEKDPKPSAKVAQAIADQTDGFLTGVAAADGPALTKTITGWKSDENGFAEPDENIIKDLQVTADGALPYVDLDWVGAASLSTYISEVHQNKIVPAGAEFEVDKSEVLGEDDFGLVPTGAVTVVAPDGTKSPLTDVFPGEYVVQLSNESGQWLVTSLNVAEDSTARGDAAETGDEIGDLISQQ